MRQSKLYRTSACALLLAATVLAAMPGLTRVNAGEASESADRRFVVDETFTVEPGKTLEYRLDNPKGVPSGRWHGHWSCRGSSAGIAGAADDTLVKFTLRGPDNKVIEKLDHPTSGNFDVRYRENGTYTFEFGNAGVVRSSKRLVRLTATFEPVKGR